MRYEHLTLDMSTAALAELRLLLAPWAASYWRIEGDSHRAVEHELLNFFNEIEARLQRTDQDPNVMLCPVCRKPEAGRDHLNVCYVDSNLDLTS